MSASTQSVLVVEDEASIASFVSLYLKNAGYEVRTASNGADALASAQNEQPSLIVLDLMLPEFDGIGFSVGREVQGIAGMFETPSDVRRWIAEMVRGGQEKR